jgi:hypothetical protein
MCPSFLVGNQHPLIQASPINRLTDSLERFEAALATLALVKKVPDSLFDQFLAALILPLASSCSTCLFKSGGNVTSTDASDLHFISGVTRRGSVGCGEGPPSYFR